MGALFTHKTLASCTLLTVLVYLHISLHINQIVELKHETLKTQTLHEDWSFIVRDCANFIYLHFFTLKKRRKGNMKNEICKEKTGTVSRTQEPPLSSIILFLTGKKLYLHHALLFYLSSALLLDHCECLLFILVLIVQLSYTRHLLQPSNWFGLLVIQKSLHLLSYFFTFIHNCSKISSVSSVLYD
jgi:hypothetical protein